MKRFGLLSIASLFLFSGLLGCNNDTRYFCVADGPISDRGCFLCRGDECDEQPAPTRIICMDDVDCAVGELCSDVGCLRECTEAQDCAIGTTCIDGLCLNPTEPQPELVSETKPDPPVILCQFNFECGESRICIDGQCLFTCIDQPCPDTQQCTDGACRPCTDETCLTNCSDDTQCADYEYCSQFQCIPDTRPETFCPENECQPGRVCRRGQCRTPCDTDDQCARIDATIRFCAPVEGENLCVRSIEVLAECQLNIDCGLGDECVDGTCVKASASL